MRGFVAWRLAFNAGAHDVVIQEDVHSIGASSIVAVATAVDRPFSGRRRALARSAPASPVMWLDAAVAGR